MSIDADLTIESFGDWLRSLESSIVCGHSNNPHGCPIAKYLIFKGYRCVTVGNHIRYLGDSFRMQPLPPWAMKFIRMVDYTSKGTSRVSEVSAFDCLGWLRKVRNTSDVVDPGALV